MKAEELCIRDWVMFPHGIDKIVDLPYIGGKGQCASFAASATLFPVPIEQLNPIPLTPEILEKNGFEKLEIYYVWADDGFELWYYSHDSILRYEFQGKLVAKSPSGMNYVHQLQHFIRLCGIDKTIEL